MAVFRNRGALIVVTLDDVLYPNLLQVELHSV